MININELQRGNLISKDGEVVKVLGLFNEMGRHGEETVDFIQLGNLLDYQPVNFEPIELTKELLEDMLGFKDTGGQFELNMMGSQLYLRGSSRIGGFYWGLNSFHQRCCEFDDVEPIRYLHQLQNFIYAMTGGRHQLDVSKVL